MHAMSHRAGVLGMAQPAHPLVKYGITYLFVQAEFGLMCPVSVSDTSNFIIKRYGSPGAEEAAARPAAEPGPGDDAEGHAVHDREGRRLGRRRARDRGRAHGRRPDGVERWKLYGQKWFCSHADADVAVMLARPRGAAPGTSGLGMFALPRRLEDGSRNSYRIVRLKDKLGTRSMALGRDHPGWRDRLSGGRRRPRLQADDGAGEPVAAEPRRARRLDDAPLPQRGAGGRARPPRLRPRHRRVSAAAPPAA